MVNVSLSVQGVYNAYCIIDNFIKCFENIQIDLKSLALSSASTKSMKVNAFLFS